MLRLLKFALVPAAVLAASTFFSSPTQASADSSCYPRWIAKQDGFDGCSGNGLLGPGNDSRSNLLMLLFDRHGSVGSTTLGDYTADYRRGEAEPFEWPLFALALSHPDTAVSALKKFNPVYDENADFTESDDDAMSRCQTNTSGAKAFLAALSQTGGMTPSEISALTNARNAMKPGCDDGQTNVSQAAKNSLAGAVKSTNAQLYATYLMGAASFYDGNFAGARNFFSLVAKEGGNSWAGESARYMLGRTELNAAINDAFDEWGWLKEGAAPSPYVATAEAGFADYLKAYPNGRYAASARGLMRKVYWLGGRKDKLAAEYAAQFALKGPRASSLVDMVQEFDSKVGEDIDLKSVSDPLLLAVLDLQAMRKNVDYDGQPYGDPPITRAALDAQKPRFAGQGALYNYVLAAHAFYVANDPAAAIKLIPADAKGSSYLDFSQQALRAMALSQLGNAGARDALVALVDVAKQPFQKGIAELALAQHEERTGAVERVFAADSKITDPDIREILLRYKAGQPLLRARAGDAKGVKRERDVATFALLYKDLTRGFYKDFTADLALVPAGAKRIAEDDYNTPRYSEVAIFNWKGTTTGFVCSSLRNVAQTLSVTPKDSTALLCVADFVRIHDLDPDFYGAADALDHTPKKDELGGTASLFPGKPFSRLEVYKAIIADPAAIANNKAYALYRAVNCYGPSGNNSCGGVDVPQSQRKAWFNKLKTSYPSSTWAKQLKYYW